MPITNISGINNNYSTSGIAFREKNDAFSPAAETSSKEKASDNDAVLNGVYGNTISTSEDGDTVQADRTSMMSAALDARVVLSSADGTVTENDSDDVSINNEKEMVDDLTGMTATQVEMLYREGRVSYRDYTEDLEDREELKEAINGEEEDTDAESVSSVADVYLENGIQTYNVTKTDDERLNEISSGQDEDTKEAVSTADANDNRAEQIDARKQSISEFDDELGKLSFVSNMTDIENIALNTAIDNGSFENIEKLGLI